MTAPFYISPAASSSKRNKLMTTVSKSRLLLLLSLLFLSLLFYQVQPAAGHDGWVEVSPSIIEKGQIATIALLHGNHSNEHRSYRIAGKWDQKYTTLVVFGPKGKPSDLTNDLVDLGEDEEKTGPRGPKGFYLAPFTPKEEGSYLAVARQVRTVQQGDGPKLLTSRTAKTAFAAFAAPTVSAAKKLKGFDRILGGQDVLEIVPRTNPLAIFSGDSVTLEVQRDGKPVAGKVVTLIRRIDGFASIQDRTTDEHGRVAFSVGPADSYLARVKFEEETPRPDGQADKNSYESTYVFQVFNRR
jgi:uncharacterized GH25 family protein